MNSKTLWVIVLACTACTLAFAADGEGSCDQSAERVKKTMRLRVGTITENPDTVRGSRVCEAKEVQVKKCAVIQRRKTDTQYFCFPTDGSEQRAEHYEIIEYYDAKSR